MIFFSFFKTLSGKEVCFPGLTAVGWAVLLCYRYINLSWKPENGHSRASNQHHKRDQVTVELKNDLAINGTLHSVDQYMNIKLDNVKVVNEDKFPHMLIKTYCTMPPVVNKEGSDSTKERPP